MINIEEENYGKLVGDGLIFCAKYGTEPGRLWGTNHFISGLNETSGSTCLKATKLYLHISTNWWTTLTGKCREYFLPWRWKTAYLKKYDIYTHVLVYAQGDIHPRLRASFNNPWNIAELIIDQLYVKCFGNEYFTPTFSLACANSTIKEEHRITHPLGSCFGSTTVHNDQPFIMCQIYRKQGILSAIMYYCLLYLTKSWQEYYCSRLDTDILIKTESPENAVNVDKNTENGSLSLLCLGWPKASNSRLVVLSDFYQLALWAMKC